VYKLSCICVIKEIQYTSATKQSIEKIILSSPKYKTPFTLYPYNHYIYKKALNTFKETAIREINKNCVNIKMSVLTDYEKLKIYEKYFIKKYLDLDDKLNKIFDERNDEDEDESDDKIDIKDML
jgi:hypothetical protein